MHPEFTCTTRERLRQTLQGKVTEATGATRKAILKYLRPPAKQAGQSLAKMPTNNQDKLQLQDSGNAQLAVQLRWGIDGLAAGHLAVSSHMSLRPAFCLSLECQDVGACSNNNANEAAGAAGIVCRENRHCEALRRGAWEHRDGNSLKLLREKGERAKHAIKKPALL